MAKNDGLLMLPYSTDENGKTIWKRVSNLVTEDPQFLLELTKKKRGGIKLNDAVMLRLNIALKKLSADSAKGS